GKLLVISGPSGSGKGTLTRALIERTGAILSISATTRQPGPGEINGKDYFFLTKAEFEAKIAAGELLEYAVVFDNYYGTPAGPVNDMLKAGKTVVLEIDVQGALQVFENTQAARGVLILPPSDQELRRRLISRGRDESRVIEKRLEKARWEIETARTSGKYAIEIVNDDLETAISELLAFADAG
ncbi:MAG: guanylate kinase, partial [Sedimentisphaerales bacterium]|nr:guanylate kinase [Sedimentisphaerales bacterium]